MPKFAFGGVGSAVATATDSKPGRIPRFAVALVCLLALSLGRHAPSRAAEAYSADAVKAEFMYRFAGYVEWPSELPPGVPFIIAVAGSDGLLAELQRLVPGRTIQNRPVEVRKVSAASELAQVQILYVAPHSQGSSHALLAAASGRPILLVSDEEGGLSHGSVVNFMQAERHVRFEISLTAADRGKLKINSGLLSVAARVEGGRPRADISCWEMAAFGMHPACLLRSVVAAADTHFPLQRILRLVRAPAAG